jgi:hypothetical protein
MWGQFDEPWGGTLAAEPGDAGGVDEPSGGVNVDDPLGAVAVEPLGPSVPADAEPDEAVVADGELLVAALATAAPPPTRTPASPTPASVCRSRIFIAFTPSPRPCCWSLTVRTFLAFDVPSGRGSRLSGSKTTLRPVPEKVLAAPWEMAKNVMARM